jgi:hypothetical protein
VRWLASVRAFTRLARPALVCFFRTPHRERLRTRHGRRYSSVLSGKPQFGKAA